MPAVNSGQTIIIEHGLPANQEISVIYQGNIYNFTSNNPLHINGNATLSSLFIVDVSGYNYTIQQYYAYGNHYIILNYNLSTSGIPNNFIFTLMPIIIAIFIPSMIVFAVILIRKRSLQ